MAADGVPNSQPHAFRPGVEDQRVTAQSAETRGGAGVPMHRRPRGAPPSSCTAISLISWTMSTRFPSSSTLCGGFVKPSPPRPTAATALMPSWSPSLFPNTPASAIVHICEKGRARTGRSSPPRGGRSPTPASRPSSCRSSSTDGRHAIMGVLGHHSDPHQASLQSRVDCSRRTRSS